MNSAILGSISAVSWGSADFMARFVGRDIGHVNAALGMLVMGALGLTGYVLFADVPFIWNWEHSWLIVASGIGVMLTTLLLYAALTRGPISVVSPIVSSYPAISIVLAVFMGASPSPVDWMTMGLVLCGVLTVARYAPTTTEPQHADPKYNTVTIIISVITAIIFSVTIVLGQLAAPIYGEVEATWLGRFVSVVAILIFIAFKKGETINLPFKWWPVFAVQGLLDNGAYVALFAAGHQPDPEIAAVTASTFGAVTVLLALIFLRERITLPQWAGIIVIFGGVASLSS